MIVVRIMGEGEGLLKLRVLDDGISAANTVTPRGAIPSPRRRHCQPTTYSLP